jgi:deoxyribodipyrimidine photo-lyase
MKPAIQLVWFKRDLRCEDHRPLAQAAGLGPVLPLYIAEPGLWAQPDAAGRHWAFIRECLSELRAELADRGQPLIVRVGEATEVLADLLDRLPVAAVWSHQETGNGWTYRRDLAVGRLLRAQGVPWHELPQNGVVRGLASRERWSREWERRMTAPLTPAPGLLALDAGLEAGEIPSHRELGLPDDPCPLRQRGGRHAAAEVLEGFLTARGERYHREMSSPLTADEACSRLSPHLAWGTLSLREAVQATRLRQRQVASLPAAQRGGWGRALAAFEGRLHWHCHFIQKLESEPRIEFENLHRACDGLRDPEPDPDRLQAWCEGRTGFPLVDACMRALAASGWINFRMRAMLMAVASYHLWLHWRAPGLHLARRFTDYKPGIHWSQVQMQSGTTGINSLRIYNPVKQSADQDPDGQFIRRWVPELAQVPAQAIHTPWRLSAAEQAALGLRIGRDYPAPIVDHEVAAREARRRLGAIRRQPQAKAEGRAIFQAHGSRRRGGARRQGVAPGRG